MTSLTGSWCASCGERFRREGDAFGHRCPPNHTGFNPGDMARVDGVTGQVITVSRSSVEVYFRQSFQAHWYAAGQLERVAA
jgi:hypothetical protein